MNERINEIRERHWRGVSAFNVGHVSSDIGYLLAEVDKYKALAENGQSAIDTNKRLLEEIELLRGQLDAAKLAGDVKVKCKASSLSPRCVLCGEADWVFDRRIDLDDSFIDKYRCKTCGEVMKVTTMRKKEVAEGGRLKN